MRIIELKEGVLAVRWQWLPYWMSSNVRVTAHVEAAIKQRIANEGVQIIENMDLLSEFVYENLKKYYRDVPAAAVVLDALCAAPC